MTAHVKVPMHIEFQTVLTEVIGNDQYRLAANEHLKSCQSESRNIHNLAGKKKLALAECVISSPDLQA